MSTRLPIVTYEAIRWFFDRRLRQLRTVEPLLEFRDLNDFEVRFFDDKIAQGKAEPDQAA